MTAPSRYWCGPDDPDPTVVQIGLVKLSLKPDFQILETESIYVIPLERNGKRASLDPFFTKLTGITEETITNEGQTLQNALNKVEKFADGARFWSWGKDELNMLGVSCFIHNILSPLPASRFDNACKLIRHAGMPDETLQKMRSSSLLEHFGLDHPELKAHDALSDAMSIAYSLQHLLQTQKLNSDDLVRDDL